MHNNVDKSDEVKMRINKLMSNAGICSRKDVNKLVEDDRIMVNGKPCFLGQWVEWDDVILFDGKPVKMKDRKYILFNKPVGITCTSDSNVSDNIINYINYPDYIFPVGRLDKESEGLMLLTNDGDLSNNVLEAEYEHEKEYIVTVDKKFEVEFLVKLSQGVEIFGVMTRPCKVKKIDDISFNIILSQGLNRQIRKMCKKFGYNVVKLKRVRIVNLLLEDLPIGKWRYLTPKELKELKKIAIKA